MSEAGERTASGWELRSYASFGRFLEALAGGSRKATLLELDGVRASIVPDSPDRSLFNSVAHERPDAIAAGLEEVRAAYRDAGVRAWTVWVPEPDAATRELLDGRGHKLDGAPRMMVCDLASVPAPDTELQLRRGPEWGAVMAINDAAYGLEEGSFERGFGSRPDPSIRAYGATHEGWLACVLATLLHEGDCFVHAVATLPEARGRGLAARLLQRALLDAREQGCATSSLQSSAAGAGVYTRLGYRDLGAVEMWEHRVFPD